MKYMFKRIFIGVAIGVILMSFKSCKAHAFQNYTLSNFSNVIYNMSFDYCKSLNNNPDLVCVDYGTITHDLKTGALDINYVPEGDYMGLKSLSIELVPSSTMTFDNSNHFYFGQVMNYGNSYNSIYGLQGTSDMRLSTFYLNQSLIKADFTLNDDSVVSLEGSDEVGTVYISTYWNNSYEIYGGGVLPSSLKNKTVKKIILYYQSNTSSYIGPEVFFKTNVPIYSSRPIFTDFISQKNNSYLSLFTNQIVQLTGFSNYIFRLGNNSFYGNTLTYQQQQINEAFSQLENQLAISQLQYGSRTPTNEEYDEFTTSITSEWSYLSTSLNTNRNFTAFLEALVNGPIIKLQNSYTNYDIYDSSDTYYLAAHTRCVSAPYRIRLWPKDNGTDDFAFNFPCMTDFYKQLHDRNYRYGFFEDQTAYPSISFAYLYAVVLHGWLSYLLVLTYLNLIKDVITPKKHEIEVLEL